MGGGFRTGLLRKPTWLVAIWLGLAGVFWQAFAAFAATPTLSGPTLYPYGAPAGSAFVVTGDFNRDGKLDLAITNFNANTLSVLLGNGDGTFGPLFASYATGINPTAIAVGDFNRDNIVDLAVTNNFYGLSIFIGNGDGTFAAAVNYVAGDQPWSVAVGDFNEDGWQDLAVGNVQAVSLFIYFNNGNGTFGTPVVYPAVSGRPTTIAVGDFNRDSHQDLAVTDWGGGGHTISIWLGNGSGWFAAPVPYEAGLAPYGLAMGDFNEDTSQDLAVTNYNGGDISILLGNGDGTFRAPVNLTTAATPVRVAVTDFDRDGHQDLIVLNYADYGSVAILMGDGHGNFAAPVYYSFASPWGPLSLAVGDFNRDGRPDLAVTYLSDPNVAVFLNSTPPSTFPININPQLYTGRYMIGGPSGNLGFFNGPKTLNLAPGNYFLGLAAEVFPQLGSGGSGHFLFTVNTSGQVVNVLNAVTRGPSGAAYANGNTLVLNNATITVNPQAYTGYWVTGAHYFPTQTRFSGTKTIVLIPELVQVIGTAFDYYTPAGTEGAHYAVFTINANGQIENVFNGITLGPSGAAVASGSTLIFNNATITIEPNAYTGKYLLGSHYHSTFQSRQNIVVIPELLNHFDNNGGYNTFTVNGVRAATAFLFMVNASGVITGAIDLEHYLARTIGASMATANGSVLSLKTINVRVDPTNYTQSYRIGGYSLGTGVRTLTLIPGLATGLIAANDVSGVFIPDVSAVNPPSLVLNILGQSYTFLFNPVNAHPVANAGTDQAVNEGGQVTLNGTGSTGDNLSYQWTQIAGPTASISNASSVTPTVTIPLLTGGFGSQVMTFKLTVTSGSQSDSATVNVTVVNVNHAPEPHPGGDQRVDEGALVRLDGHFSFDPDGDPITYQWLQTAGTPVTLGADPNDMNNPAKAAFIAPTIAGGIAGPETLTFKLVVSDTQLASEGYVNVVVENVNHAPTANAGNSQTVHPGTTVYLVGSGDDPDYDQINYQWTQVSGTSVSMINTNSATAYFVAPPVSGTTDLKFRLTVSDGLLSAFSDVVLTVKNGAPVCYAARAVPDVLWPANHSLVSVRISGVTDPDDGSVAINIASVTQDEPVNGTGDGDTSPDAVLQGDKVLLRAERSGNGNGRVYRVNFTANDGNGGTCTGSVNVGVPRDMKPGSIAIDSSQSYNSTQP